MLASITKAPEFMLESGEAEMLALAVGNVARHYDVGASMAPEVVAWINLAQTAGIIYGPRIFAARARAKLAAQNNGQIFQ